MIKKRPYLLTIAALVLLVLALIVDNFVVRLSTAAFTVIILIVLVLEVVSFIMIRRAFNAELKKSTVHSVPETLSEEPSGELSDEQASSEKEA